MVKIIYLYNAGGWDLNKLHETLERLFGNIVLCLMGNREYKDKKGGI